ncbi:glycosyltransferase [Reichenbachiella carrageenanivorans]|uniref:Glycosyltransferase n=1 Tax=Reichenbachiella carrageenanivorans TaxID=2979869 RepID=A0ABY6D4I1_9BACT|nr:glycosyltransferase [Reichenbachiella carrageenanivorans]UXX80814.1 glycosyltransferase [Reichenbachiella carrageenanivorans]
MTDFSISIIIPCYNAEEHLASAIQSIIDLEIENLEIIVVDDGSTDNSITIARSFDKIQLISQANSGPAAARNRGIEAASGDIIGFLDADDLYPDQKIKIQLDYLRKNPDTEIVSGRIQCFGDQSDHMYIKIYEDAAQKTMLNFHVGANLYRKNVFDKIGGFDVDLRYAEDVDHWFKIVEQGINYHFLSEVTLLHRRHHNNMTNVSQGIQNPYFIRAIKKSMDRRKKLDKFDLPNFFKNSLSKR